MLAEIIKNSKLDINSLAAFVRSNQIEPDWMSMHLPYGKCSERLWNPQLTKQVGI